MFTLNEIDKLLESMITTGKRNKRRHRINLPDIERVDVSRLNLKVDDAPLTSSYDETSKVDRTRMLKIKPTFEASKRLSTDLAFAIQVNRIIAPILGLTPERPYPAAKLVICDEFSLGVLRKFQKIICSRSLVRNSMDFRNFLHKSPYNVTAMFSIKNLSDLLDRTTAPKIVDKLDRSTGKVVKQLNYPLIQKEFPYLKLTDSIVILLDKRKFDMIDGDLAATEPQLAIQFLKRFSRSARVVELVDLVKQFGRSHPVYDNVVTFAPNVEPASLKLNLNMLTIYADQFVRLTTLLRLRVERLNYRSADHMSSCKLFSQLVASSLETPAEHHKRKDYQPARVVVVDRFVDLQGFLLHSDLYGPYMEQERVEQSGDQQTKFGYTLDPIDELDDLLQLCPLNETLNSVMRYASELKPGGQADSREVVPSVMAIMSSSQSLLRHLTVIKDLYRTLDQGYLLLLRIESSLVMITDHLKDLSESPSLVRQEELALRLQRIYRALKQLIRGRFGDTTNGLMSLTRIACLIVDTINVFLYLIASKDSRSMKAETLLASIRQDILDKFKKVATSSRDGDDCFENSTQLREILIKFDKISRDTCYSRSSLKLESIVKSYISNNLDDRFYPSIKINGSQEVDLEGCVILVFLGPMTPYELGKIKILKGRKGTREILILCADIWCPMIPIQGCVKNYHWGKKGQDNYIAKFLNAAQIRQDPDESERPLAELWFGSHPSGPATILIKQLPIKLDAFFKREPSMVGTMDIYGKFNRDIPFLFKVLSVDQPLSLQVHPDKKRAEELHLTDPINYPDSNHKPELAIALTEFQVLCDFRPAAEIESFMKQALPFRRVVKEANLDKLSKALKEGTQEAVESAIAESFKSLMRSSSDIIKKECHALLRDNSSSSKLDRDLLSIIARLDKLYPGDPGVLAPLFLNFITLKPGQAIYLKANKLHAYLKGECIECMACSDNVVRAGLTTKHRDIDTLLSLLDYKPIKQAHDILFTGTSNSRHPEIISYAPSAEFKVDRIDIDLKSAPNREYHLSSLHGGSFMIVLNGQAFVRNFFDSSIEHKIRLGSAGFIPPKVATRLYNIQEPMTIYRSYC